MKNGSQDKKTGDADRMTLEESVARAMDGSDGRIVPFLPYIFQDAWELGAVPGMVIDLVRRHARDRAGLSVLDLGCGKGAVSVKLAAAFGCRCLGIDAIPEFVAFADAKAAEAGVAHLCRFEVADIRERIEGLGRFDIIVLGAIGPVFGDYRETLGVLAPHLAENGLVVVDDGYLPDDSPQTHPQVLKRADLLRQIAAAGMRVIEEVPVPGEELKRLNETLYRGLERRCAELAGTHPELKDVFEDYVRRQMEENAFLEGDVVCVVLAIGRTAAALPT
jgi:SAM-dependent methyltransferase